MPERVRFSEGVSRLHGSELESPYDLTNAELRKVQGVRALGKPAEPTSDVPSVDVDGRIRPAEWQREIRRHGEVWRDQVRAAAQRGSVLYASEGDGYAPELRKYEVGDPDFTSPIPQILSAETREGNFPTIGTIDTLRFAYYLLIPVNADGEAGPHHYAGAKIPDGDNLPELIVETNEHVQNIDLYRTALFEDGSRNPERGATAFYRVGLQSANRSGLSQSGQTQEYWTSPPYDEAGLEDDDSTYYNATGIDYIYLSARSWNVLDQKAPDPVEYPTDPSGWGLEFQYLADGQDRTTSPVGGLDTGVRYVVRTMDTDPNGFERLRLEDQNGNSLSFDGSAVVRTATPVDFLARGVKIRWFPPDQSVQDDGSVIIRDDKQWSFDVDDEGNQPNVPTGDPLDRPQNVHTATSTSATETSGRTETSQSGLTTAAYDDLYYSGGLLYGAAPRWPLDRPQATFVRRGSNGRGLRAQFEYSVDGDTYFGPPLEIPDCEKFACAWQGVEQALHLFVAQTLTFDVVNTRDTGDGTAAIYIDDPEGNFEYIRDEYDESGFRRGVYNPDTISFVNPSNGNTETWSLDFYGHNPTYNSTSHPDETEINISPPAPPPQGGYTVDPENIITTDFEAQQEGFAQLRRITPSQVGGAYLYEGSSIIFDASELTNDDFMSTIQTRESTSYLKESDAVFFSNVNRPLEMTFDQFRAPEGAVVRGVFRSRLAEREGLRAYDFYVGTEGAIYVVNPSVEDRSMSLQAVTSQLGIGLTPTDTPAYTLLPSGALIKGTDDRIHSLSGRQERRLFPDGLVPWSSVRDLQYTPQDEIVYVSTPEGIWGYDTDREAITLQYDLDATSLAHDTERSAVICYDQEASAWKVLDESGPSLAASVTTQPIGHGGARYEVRRASMDYDTAGYSPTDSTTHASIHETRRGGPESNTYTVPRRYEVSLNLRGAGLQYVVKGFGQLRELVLDLQRLRS